MANDARLSSGPSDNERRVLVLPPTRADALAIDKLFGAHSIPCVLHTNAAQLLEEQRSGAAALIVSEVALLEHADDFVAALMPQPVWSDLPILVLSRSGRESAALAGVVARLGNVSVVERPIRTSTLVSLVRSCLRARERQYQMREYLLKQARSQRALREAQQTIETERERLLEAERAARGDAERANRIKDEFLATLSHELRTPLHSILGWTYVMRRSRELPREVAAGLDVIERNARVQAQIIEDLLDMSRIVSGKVRLHLESVDLGSVLRSTVDTVRPSAQAKDIRLDVTIDPADCTVRGDGDRVQQVLWNLLTNAVKFTRKEGRIGVTLACESAQVRVEVTDDGEGIDPDFLPHIFDRFRQADASTARRHGGLGLGLSIVKNLVELHGGAVAAESAGHNAGALFRVTLPLAATAAQAAGAAAAAGTVGDGSGVAAGSDEGAAARGTAPFAVETAVADLHGMKILVVDDEPDARSLLQRLFRNCNASVVAASSADEAVEALLRDAPDVLISDIGMPGADGYVLIRRVRSLGGAKGEVPAIALTAYAHSEDKAKALRAGFQSHLSKPIEPKELISAVESLAVRGFRPPH
ncbi:MAG TPA: ATP-binding protein [Gammaproteobacteria bacterium]|nr:ATP-binding protein [Gammaproteobacteria bacterium]